MNRAARRRFDKEFSKVLKTSGDACGLCGEALKHNSQTFGGIAPGNHVVLTGECCAQRLETVMGSGVYINENTDAILSVMNASKSSSGDAPPDPLVAARQLRLGISALDKATAELMRKGGVKRSPSSISITDNPWKTDDATWFKNHPGRSHRLRPLHPEEATTLPAGLMHSELPDDHRWEILVRQVKEGQRIRTALCRNTKMSIPDVEEVIHAIFDIVMKAEGSGVISVEEVAALATRYRVPTDASRN